METGSTPATIPALSAPAFMAHPTRFERVTVAFRALLVTPNRPLQGRCRRTANRLNEPHAPVAQLDRALPSEGNSPFPELIFMGLWRVRPRVAVPLPAARPAPPWQCQPFGRSPMFRRGLRVL